MLGEAVGGSDGNKLGVALGDMLGRLDRVLLGT